MSKLKNFSNKNTIEQLFPFSAQINKINNLKQTMQKINSDVEMMQNKSKREEKITRFENDII